MTWIARFLLLFATFGGASVFAAGQGLSEDFLKFFKAKIDAKSVAANESSADKKAAATAAAFGNAPTTFKGRDLTAEDLLEILRAYPRYAELLEALESENEENGSPLQDSLLAEMIAIVRGSENPGIQETPNTVFDNIFGLDEELPVENEESVTMGDSEKEETLNSAGTGPGSDSDSDQVTASVDDEAGIAGESGSQASASSTGSEAPSDSSELSTTPSAEDVGEESEDSQSQAAEAEDGTIANDEFVQEGSPTSESSESSGQNASAGPVSSKPKTAKVSSQAEESPSESVSSSSEPSSNSQELGLAGDASQSTAPQASEEPPERALAADEAGLVEEPPTTDYSKVPESHSRTKPEDLDMDDPELPKPHNEVSRNAEKIGFEDPPIEGFEDFYEASDKISQENYLKGPGYNDDKYDPDRTMRPEVEKEEETPRPEIGEDLKAAIRTQRPKMDVRDRPDRSPSDVEFCAQYEGSGGNSLLSPQCVNALESNPNFASQLPQIVLDPGHLGGHYTADDRGGPGSFREGRGAFATALLTQRILSTCYHYPKGKIPMTRYNLYHVPGARAQKSGAVRPQMRLRQANIESLKSDDVDSLFISIHTNGSKGHNVQRAEVFQQDKNDVGFGDDLLNGILDSLTGSEDRSSVLGLRRDAPGTKVKKHKDSLAVLSAAERAGMQAILTEGFFYDYETEDLDLHGDLYQEQTESITYNAIYGSGFERYAEKERERELQHTGGMTQASDVYNPFPSDGSVAEGTQMAGGTVVQETLAFHPAQRWYAEGLVRGIGSRLEKLCNSAGFAPEGSRSAPNGAHKDRVPAEAPATN